MKILILGFTKVKYMPYMHFYLDNIRKSGHEVHILYWNRDDQPEDLSQFDRCIFHEFRCYQEDDVSKLAKIRSFLQYRQFAKKLLLSAHFDLVFVLHTLPGILVLDVLKKHYPGRYILDYRDSTYEAFPPFQKAVNTLAENAIATFVSSDAFRRFLPRSCSERIYTSHNLLLDSLQHRQEKDLYGTPSEKIRIGFWGFIRHEELNREILRKLAKDPRFELHYYGREQQVAHNLKAYARELGAENVFFHGEYTPEERYTFVRSTDILHNLYSDANMALAMGNKYYDGLIFRIPQICMPGSFMGECVQRAQVGFLLDPADEHFSDKIFSAYHTLDQSRFRECCDAELERVLKEYTSGVETLQEVLT